jgi:hypothetical protein
MQWEIASSEMVEIQKAITYYSFSNQRIEEVAEDVKSELEDMSTYRLVELVEELGIKLEKRFIGFNN